MKTVKDGVQLLRAQMVRRLPTKAQPSAQSRFAPTPRDEEILAAVYRHGVLTRELIELAFFPTSGFGRSGPSSPAYVRLHKLWLSGYLERIELPVSRALGGSRPFLYALGAKAVPLLGQKLELGTRPVHRRRLDRLDDVFREHDLKVASLWAHLQALLRGTDIRQAWWVGDRDLRAQPLRVRDRGGGGWLPVLPDACFALEYPDRTEQSCVLEVDMGTLSQERFARKLRALEMAREDGALAQAWGWGYESCEVLVLTHSPGRLQQLWQTGRREVPEARWSAYLFATFSILTREDFGGKVWRTLEDRRAGLLHNDAFEGERNIGFDGAR